MGSNPATPTSFFLMADGHCVDERFFMKYVSNGTFTDKQLSIDETISELSDVVAIAKDVSGNLLETVSADTKKELNLIIANLSEAQSLLSHIKRKTDIALKYVPTDIQDKEYL